MTFEWDEGKNRAKIKKYGFDFAEAEQMFAEFLSSISTRGRTTEKGAGEESARFADGRLSSFSQNFNFHRTSLRDHSNHFVEKGRS
jgi:hypothetical protein